MIRSIVASGDQVFSWILKDPNLSFNIDTLKEETKKQDYIYILYSYIYQQPATRKGTHKKLADATCLVALPLVYLFFEGILHLYISQAKIEAPGR